MAIFPLYSTTYNLQGTTLFNKLPRNQSILKTIPRQNSSVVCRTLFNEHCRGKELPEGNARRLSFAIFLELGIKTRLVRANVHYITERVLATTCNLYLDLTDTVPSLEKIHIVELVELHRELHCRLQLAHGGPARLPILETTNTIQVPLCCFMWR